LGRENLELLLRSLRKVFGPLQQQTTCGTGKNTSQALVTSWKNGMGSYSRHRVKEQAIKHIRMVVQLHQLERLTSQWRLSSLNVVRKQCALSLRLRIS